MCEQHAVELVQICLNDHENAHLLTLQMIGENLILLQFVLITHVNININFLWDQFIGLP